MLGHVIYDSVRKLKTKFNAIKLFNLNTINTKYYLILFNTILDNAIRTYPCLTLHNHIYNLT